MSAPRPQLPPDPHDPYRYGWRPVPKRRPDGSLYYERMPLSETDFLDPQPGDVMIQGALHWECANDLYDRFKLRYLNDSRIGVFADLKMRWGIVGLEEPAPDVAIIPGLRDKLAPRESFDIVAEGTRPCLVVEVMSPHYAGDDTEKVRIYEQAGIPEYLIVKPYGPQHERDFSLYGYRLVGGRYRPWGADAEGRLHSLGLGVRFGVRSDHQGLEVLDAVTGEPLRNLVETELARQRDAQRAEVEAERASRAELEAERLKARLRAHGIEPD
jgi:Uma2 family endonuclease